MVINVVWFKRDLRLRDHESLSAARKAGLPMVLLYCFEPSLMNAAESDIRHWRFVWQSLMDINAQLQASNKDGVLIYYGEVKSAFEVLQKSYTIQSVFSHQETGLEVTYHRDLAMAQYFKSQNIAWDEYQYNGVIRGKKNRDQWSKSWYSYMGKPLCDPYIKALDTIKPAWPDTTDKLDA